jgi:hypothetical protein
MTFSSVSHLSVRSLAHLYLDFPLLGFSSFSFFLPSGGLSNPYPLSSPYHIHDTEPHPASLPYSLPILLHSLFPSFSLLSFSTIRPRPCPSSLSLSLSLVSNRTALPENHRLSTSYGHASPPPPSLWLLSSFILCVEQAMGSRPPPRIRFPSGDGEKEGGREGVRLGWQPIKAKEGFRFAEQSQKKNPTSVWGVRRRSMRERRRARSLIQLEKKKKVKMRNERRNKLRKGRDGP